MKTLGEMKEFLQKFDVYEMHEAARSILPCIETNSCYSEIEENYMKLIRLLDSVDGIEDVVYDLEALEVLINDMYNTYTLGKDVTPQLIDLFDKAIGRIA